MRWTLRFSAASIVMALVGCRGARRDREVAAAYPVNEGMLGAGVLKDLPTHRNVHDLFIDKRMLHSDDSPAVHAIDIAVNVVQTVLDKQLQ